MKKYIVFYLMIIFSLLFIGCANSISEKLSKNSSLAYLQNNGPINTSSVDWRRYDYVELDNQLTVTLVNDPRAQVSTASLIVRAGSAYDPDEQLGLAHYVEHAALLGSKNYPQPNGLHLFQRQHNGLSNALTSREHTEFFLSSSKQDFTESLAMLGDAIADPLFNPGLAMKERETIHAEWSSYRNNDLAVIEQINNITYDPSSPRLRMRIGNLQTLADKKNSSLLLEAKKFHEQYYSAANMHLTLVGSQPLSVLKLYANTYFGKIKKSNENPGLLRGKASSKKNALGKILRFKPFSSIKRLYIDFPIVNDSSNWDKKSYEYLHSLFSSTDENTLLGHLKYKNIIDGANVSYARDLYGTHGFFRIDFGLTESGLNQTDYILAAVFSYIDLVKRRGLTHWRYKEAQEISARNFARSVNVPALVLAREISSRSMMYPTKNLLDGPYAYTALDRTFLQSTLDNWIPRNARIWHINEAEHVDTPVPYFDRMYRVNDIVPSQEKGWVDQAKDIHLALPVKNDLANPPLQPLITTRNGSPQVLLSEPGIEAFLFQPQSIVADSGRIVVELNSSINYLSDENFVMAELLRAMAERETGFLISKANKAYMSLTTARGNENALRYQVSGDTAYLDRLLLQVLQRLSTMLVTEQSLDNQIALFKKNFNATNGTLRQSLKRYQEGLLFNEQLSPDNYRKVLDNITLEKFVAFQQQFKNTVLVRLFVTGNFSEERALSIAHQVKQLFPGNRLPDSRKLNSQWQSKKSTTSVTVRSRFADNGILFLYLSDDLSIKERISIAILDKLLSPLFFNEVRSEKKLGYVIDSTPYMSGVNPGFEFFIQSPTTSPHQLQKSIESFLVNSLRKVEATSDDTIQALKRGNLNVFVADAEHTNDFINANYQFNQNELYSSVLSGIDKEDIIETYNRLFLNPNRLLIMVSADNEQ